MDREKEEERHREINRDEEGVRETERWRGRCFLPLRKVCDE